MQRRLRYGTSAEFEFQANEKDQSQNDDTPFGHRGYYVWVGLAAGIAETVRVLAVSKAIAVVVKNVQARCINNLVCWLK